MLDRDSLLARAEEEIERSLRARRPLAVAVIVLSDQSKETHRAVVEAVLQTVRLVDVVGAGQGSELVVLMPETSADAVTPATRILAALGPITPGVHIGLSRCPCDAHLADALIEGARAAAGVAPPGGVAEVGRAVVSIEAGEHVLVTASASMKELFERVRRLAASDIPVLLCGETGTGKEMLASALHAWSDRAAGPLVAVNCAAITESLFESEVFGHERGAFTNASTSKEGLLERAHGGTVLLDEIGDCPMQVQAKLLRAVETRRICRVGSVSERLVDVRFVAATNRDLRADIGAGRFRRDLFFRLSAACVTVPPLRERTLDVPILARRFLDLCRARAGGPATIIADETLRRLLLHDWPGNVRELKGVIESCAATVTSETILPQDLPPEIAGEKAAWLARAASARGEGDGSRRSSPFEPFATRTFKDLDQEIQELERTRMVEALAATGGVGTAAARLLGMPLRTFATKLKLYRLRGAGA